ncbi:lysozyme [Novosphingobium sp.]|uniref:lysozyme n=1 Tax=Novosphingobium sp. TaxID=1874826 RepID=UPI0031D48468
MPGEPIEAASAARGLLKKGTLAFIVGPATAALLLTNIPAEESGRKVDVTIAKDGAATVKPVSGPQYLKVYLDMVGVATACDGLTGKGIKMGLIFTEAQCAVMLESRLAETGQEVMACTPGLALTIPGRDRVRAAAVSLAYNVGTPTYCKSTMRAQINAGQIKASCTSLTWFNRAGGRVVDGLVKRRGREQALCLMDVA